MELLAVASVSLGRAVSGMSRTENPPRSRRYPRNDIDKYQSFLAASASALS